MNELPTKSMDGAQAGDSERKYPTKSERKRKRLEAASAYVAEVGMEADPSTIDGMREILSELLEELGLEPQIDPSNKQIEAVYVDDNDYAGNRRRFQHTSQNLRAAIYEHLKLRERGGPREKGDIGHLSIHPVGARILAHHFGQDWRERLRALIRERYSHGGFGKSYHEVGHGISLKVAQRVVLTRVALGDEKLQHDQIVLSGKTLPAAMLVGLAGKSAGDIVEGSPHGGALDGALIREAIDSDGTTIIRLDDTLIPVGGDDDGEDDLQPLAARMREARLAATGVKVERFPWDRCPEQEKLEWEALALRQISFDYVNWRGESGTRIAIPMGLRWGSTEWHPVEGWLMEAWDLEKGAYREFSLADCRFSRGAPQVGAGT